MNHTSGDTMRRALDGIRSIVQALRVESRQLEQNLGMSLAQLEALSTIAEDAPPSLNAIAERLGTHQSSASVVVSRLAKRGYVKSTMSTIDRRRRQFEVTTKGKSVLVEKPQTVSDRLLEGHRVFTPEEGRQLADLLTKWTAAAGLA